MKDKEKNKKIANQEIGQEDIDRNGLLFDFSYLSKDPDPIPSKEWGRFVRKGYSAATLEFLRGDLAHRKGVSMYYLLRVNFRQGVLFGRTKEEVYRKIGFNEKKFRSYMSQAIKMGIIRYEFDVVNHLYRVVSIRKILSRKKYRGRIFMINHRKLGSDIKQSIEYLQVIAVIKNQKYVKAAIREKYREENSHVVDYKRFKANDRAVKRYVKQYGDSSCSVDVVSLRKISKRTGVAKTQISTILRLAVAQNLISKKVIKEYFSDKHEKSFSNYKSFNKVHTYIDYKLMSIVRILGTHYFIRSNSFNLSTFNSKRMNRCNTSIGSSMSLLGSSIGSDIKEVCI